MSMHKQSENMNDPSRLSAVVQSYEILRLHDWEKFKKYSTNMTYKNGRSIIKVCSCPFYQPESYQIDVL